MYDHASSSPHRASIWLCALVAATAAWACDDGNQSASDALADISDSDLTDASDTTDGTDASTDAGETGETGDVADVADAVLGGICDDDDASTVRPAGWEKASHCKGEDPNYGLLFDDTVVQRLDITVSADNYAATIADLESLLGGSGGPGGPGGPGGVDLDEDPIYVPVTLEFDGQTWNHVGMRYKGNSSLSSAWRMGVRKLAFRLNFDKFEDAYPEIDDQRFHGFKKMTFSNGFNDESLIRDKLAADLFRDGGVPAARGAFARVYVDFGEGETYFGLYTMIEDPSDEMLGVQFGDDDGNLYKPDGDAATWAFFDAETFEKKTHEDAEDWSDVIAVIDTLNADRSDAEAWRAALEARFDVELFLRVLAINQAMVNWDAYGTMTHNYYVYADPSDQGRLKWFPWDLDESMLTGRNPTSVMLDETTASWPLIRYLLDDPIYRAQYRLELEAALAGPLAIEDFAARARAYHDLIAPWVAGENGEQGIYTLLDGRSDFAGSVDGPNGLIEHIEAQHLAVEAALAAE